VINTILNLAYIELCNILFGMLCTFASVGFLVLLALVVYLGTIIIRVI